jgi:uncharacterized protein YjbJ (UPF0337 family)
MTGGGNAGRTEVSPAGRLPAGTEEVGFMSGERKIKNAAEEAKGTVKRETGRAAADPYLEAEGSAEKRKASLKQAGQKIKDAFKR